MDQCLKAGGRMTKQMDEGDSFMVTEMYMKEIGLMIKRTALECTHMQMGQVISANGKVIFSTDLA
jgi:hypothetical protein